MDSTKWQKIKNILSTLLDLPENEHSEFLASIDDEEIRLEVEKLLSAQEQAENFIDTPILIEKGLADDATKDSLIGKTIENYLILERIGTGGMGAVYLAERLNSDFKQKVALKIIKRGMDSEAILTRFATERRILSTLKHPNIAQLLDGGISSEGLPFFVMEYVDGKPLNQFCDENELALNERLQIFRQICSAVENAHKHLIIHRDLKPSNVLVTSDGIPKLLDFGIGKLLSNDGDEATLTATQGRVFTPEYASPEQVLGKSVTTATDVYSLGVILYELLSGHRPFETKGRTFEEIVKSICETEPTAPSYIWQDTETRRHGDTETPALATEKISPSPFLPVSPSQIRGDLDNIILKALRKETSERYGSVQQFSEDIVRFLQGLPVLARPQTVKYRFGKYVKRHKAGVLAVAMVLLSLIGGISVATWQAIIARRERTKAEQRFNDVRQLANTILFDHYERIKKLPGATEARAKLVSDALVYLDKIAQESSDNPDLQRELVAGYRRLADIQGGVGEGGNSGDEISSRENYLKALSMQEKLVAANRSNIEDERNLGKLFLDVSSLFENENGRLTQADYVEKGLNIFQKLKDENPNKTQGQADLAKAFWYWANIVRLKGDNDGAIETYTRALEIYDELGTTAERNKVYQRSAALTRKNIGSIYSLKKDYQKALEFYQMAFLFDRENANSSPDNVETQMDLSFSHKSLANLFLKLNEKQKGIAEYELAREIQEKVFTIDPRNRFAAIALFRTYLGIAELHRDEGNFPKAETYYQNCKQVLARGDEEQRSVLNKIDAANYYWSYGNFFMKNAENRKSNSEKLVNLKSARGNLTDAINIYQTLQKQNILDPAYSKNPPEIAALIEKANREISRLAEK